MAEVFAPYHLAYVPQSLDGESCPAQRSGSTAPKPPICSAAQLVPLVYATELRTVLAAGLAYRICSASAGHEPPRDSRCRTHHPRLCWTSRSERRGSARIAWILRRDRPRLRRRHRAVSRMHIRGRPNTCFPQSRKAGDEITKLGSRMHDIEEAPTGHCWLTVSSAVADSTLTITTVTAGVGVW